MATKTKVKKEVKAKREPAKIDENTGCRVGSLGFAIGKAYQGEETHEKAIAAVEDVLKASLKAKGKSTKDEYVHLRAVSWVGFLKKKSPKLYPELESEKTGEKVEA